MNDINDKSQNKQKICFPNPGYPFVKIPPNYKPQNNCTFTTQDQLKQVQEICSVYADCTHKNCRSQIKRSGHGVMCPTSEFTKSLCLYEWGGSNNNSSSSSSHPTTLNFEPLLLMLQNGQKIDCNNINK